MKQNRFKYKFNNPHFHLYLGFLAEQIPNILQILSFPSILGFVLQNKFVSFWLIPVVIGLLVNTYLIRVMFNFIEKEVTSKTSFLKRHKLDSEKMTDDWCKYIFRTSLVLSFIACMLGQIFYASTA